MWKYAKVEMKPPSFDEFPQIKQSINNIIVGAKTQKFMKMPVKVISQQSRFLAHLDKGPCKLFSSLNSSNDGGFISTLAYFHILPPRVLVFCVVFCRSLLFCPFAPFVLAIVLSVLPITTSDYPFGIFKLFIINSELYFVKG
jgi:hypothetical protein